MRISYSDISSFLWCQRKWHYQSNLRLEGKILEWDLLLGSAIHFGLEKHFGNESMPQAVAYYWKQMYEYLQSIYVFSPDEKLKLSECYDLSLAMSNAYIEWSKHNDMFHVVAIEQPFEIAIPGTDGIFSGVIDGIVEEDGALWLLEHKTRTTFSDVETLILDLQTSLYQWALTLLVRAGQFFAYPADTEVRGVLFTMLKKSKIEEPKLIRNNTALSQDKSVAMTYEMYEAALRKYGFDATHYVDTLERLRVQQHPLVRRFRYVRTDMELARIENYLSNIYAAMSTAVAQGQFLPTYTTSCRYCPFFAVCKAERRGGDTEQLLSSFTQRPQREELRVRLALEKDKLEDTCNYIL